MSERVSGLLEEIGAAARALPDVFSTAQWGGRAYKVPGPGGNVRRPKLVAFVATTKEGDAVGVSFKLPPDRATETIDRYAWIEPHAFGTLGRTGWVSARVSQKRQLGVIGRLLKETRGLYPVQEGKVEEEAEAGAPAARRPGRPASAEAVRIDRVMGEARAAGWVPPAEGDW
jgi:hypothetical protein